MGERHDLTYLSVRTSGPMSGTRGEARSGRGRAPVWPRPLPAASRRAERRTATGRRRNGRSGEPGARRAAVARGGLGSAGDHERQHPEHPMLHAML